MKEHKCKFKIDIITYPKPNEEQRITLPKTILGVSLNKTLKMPITIYISFKGFFHVLKTFIYHADHSILGALLHLLLDDKILSINLFYMHGFIKMGGIGEVQQ